MLRAWSPLIVGVAAVALVASGGCNRPAPQEKKAPDGEHGHKPGQHGGTIFEIGKDNYHTEAVFGAKGELTLYMLAKDEAKIQEVDAQALTAHARAVGETKSVEFTLQPRRRPDDGPGKTSVFVGTLPEGLRDRRVDVTVPTIRIGGDRFRFAVRNYTESSHGMPAPVASEKAKQLYLKPGGKYTEADIKTNGNQTARQKYGDEMPEHDINPKKGAKICPITLTVANPKFTWVVAGKSYQFCCPPCIDEFVKTAKEKPDQIKEPGEYVKK